MAQKKVTERCAGLAGGPQRRGAIVPERAWACLEAGIRTRKRGATEWGKGREGARLGGGGRASTRDEALRAAGKLSTSTDSIDGPRLPPSPRSPGCGWLAWLLSSYSTHDSQRGTSVCRPTDRPSNGTWPLSPRAPAYYYYYYYNTTLSLHTYLLSSEALGSRSPAGRCARAREGEPRARRPHAQPTTLRRIGRGAHIRGQAPYTVWREKGPSVGTRVGGLHGGKYV